MIGRQGRRMTIPWGIIKRIGVYSAVMLVLSIIQCSFLARLKILPATPDLILAAVSVIAIIDDRDTAVISGIIGGIFIDAVGGVGIYLSPILYFGVALLIWVISQKMMPRYLSWLAVFPTACVLRAAFTLLQVYLFGQSFEFVPSLRYIILPEAIMTIVFALPQYPIMRLCTAPLRDRHSMSLR